MEGRNIPLIVMLLAGSAVSIACIIYRFSLLNTLIFVFLTLLAFYLIGLILKRIIVKINRDAEKHAALLAKERAEMEESIEHTASTEEEAAEQQDDFSVS